MYAVVALIAQTFEVQQRPSMGGFVAIAVLSFLIGTAITILFLVVAWRAMKAHESLADSARRAMKAHESVAQSVYRITQAQAAQGDRGGTAP